MHYYQFNIGDYASHTRHLSMMEDLIYRRLLDWYYLNEKPIPKDCIQASRLIQAKDHFSDVEQILNEFFTLTDDGWINKRADAEISHFKAKSEQASKAGKASAQARFNGCSTDVQPNNKHKPITINQETSKILSKTFVLPDWINSDDWNLWLKTRKKKMVVEQMQAQIKKLEKWKNDGLDYALSLKNSAENGYQGLFEPERKINGVKQNMPWWATNEMMLAKGKELGTEPRPGEDWPQFKSRLSAMVSNNG